MEAAFPLGLSLPTAIYLSLYIATLILHVVFMNYVVAGTGYLAIRHLLPGDWRGDGVAGVLKDWMPFALSAAITAGVAPFLFLQILYPEAFYTSQLLLSPRWVILLTSLSIGFYLLYLSKTERAGRWPASVHATLWIVVLLCFLYTGFSWSEGHLLALEGQEYWASFYGGRSRFHADPELLPRLAVLLTGALPTMALLVGWQLRYLHPAQASAADARYPRRLALLALSGILLAVATGAWYHRILPVERREVIVGPLARPYLVVAGCGLLLQALAWGWSWKRRRLGGATLVLASAGAVAAILGASVVREGLRLESLDLGALEAAHAAAFEVAGLPLFLLFLLLNGSVIAGCLILVRREYNLRKSA